jgi:hypothetical protein
VITAPTVVWSITCCQYSSLTSTELPDFPSLRSKQPHTSTLSVVAANSTPPDCQHELQFSHVQSSSIYCNTSSSSIASMSLPWLPHQLVKSLLSSPTTTSTTTAPHHASCATVYISSSIHTITLIYNVSTAQSLPRSHAFFLS